MRKYRLALVALLASAFLVQPSYGKTGFVSVSLMKLGLIAGAGAGSGVLAFDGHDYPFRVYGLSIGATVGLSSNRLVGRAWHLHRLSDFDGIYTGSGSGGALVGGGGGVQLKNDKGVVIWLRGAKSGFEFSANLSGVRIVLAQRPASS
jgi:hypothetical protein